MAASLHDDAVVFDGLIVSRWGPEIFRDMRRGGLTGANCTCSVWEGFEETMTNIGRWKRWFGEYGDLITQAFTVADIRRAKREGRTGIVLGFQNTWAFGDRLELVGFFKDLGVGIAQMTYNTQNLAGAGCYESRDGGLSDFGRDMVAEMNRVGMMCDLSHVGPRTSMDVILASARPVCYSHCLPSAMKAHPRNKSDQEMRFMAEHGGFIGVTMFPPFLAKGNASTVADYVEAIEYVIDIAGEDNVGIGTDFTQDHDQEFFDYITHDKGSGRRLTEFGDIVNPEGLRRIGEFPNLTAAMERAGWPETRIRKILGENWLRVLEEVWEK